MKEIFKQIRQDLNAAVAAGHPYHTMVMGTVGLDRMARLRTVVLRKVEDDLSLWCYTDRRSKKVMHLIENEKVSLLFYNPETQIQLKIEGLGEILENKALIEGIYNAIPEKGRRDYQTQKAPGSTISGPEAIEYLDTDHNLCVLRVRPFKIEYLRLGDPEHTRIRFSKSDDGGWDGEYLVP